MKKNNKKYGEIWIKSDETEIKFSRRSAPQTPPGRSGAGRCTLMRLPSYLDRYLYLCLARYLYLYLARYLYLCLARYLYSYLARYLCLVRYLYLVRYLCGQAWTHLYSTRGPTRPPEVQGLNFLYIILCLYHDCCISNVLRDVTSVQ